MNAAREFVNGIAGQVSMPEVYVAIRKLLHNPDGKLDEMVKVVETDPMLSLRIMRLTQSPYFGYTRNCGNLHQAINFIGFMQLHDLLICCLCLRNLSAIPEQIFNFREFWRYCVQCAIAAKTIGKYSRGDNSSAFFTLGLLHEIGHAMMFMKVPEASLQAIEIARQSNRELASVELETLGFNYTQVGAEMMQIWQLPPLYQQAASFHLQPELADKEYRFPIEVVHLAHEICQDLDSLETSGLVKNSIEQVVEFKGLPDNINQIIRSEIDEYGDLVLEIFWPSAAEDLTIAGTDNSAGLA